MSSHKIACILLAAVVLLMGFGVNKVRGKAVKARQAAESVRIQAQSAEQQKQMAEIKLKSFDSQTAELRGVYTEWLPYLKEFSNSGDGEQRIREVIREGDVFVISQKVKSIKIDKSGFISHALGAEIEVEDDYTKVMNWLGELEETLPSCQITKCKITRGDRGNNVHMEVKLQVPIVKATPTAKPKAKVKK